MAKNNAKRHKQKTDNATMHAVSFFTNNAINPAIEQNDVSTVYGVLTYVFKNVIIPMIMHLYP